MKSIFQHSKDNPFHISVGALVTNTEGKICVHHAEKEKMPEKYKFFCGTGEDIYYLMRESLENGESLEQAVLRGVSEEFGMSEARIVRYLGSIQELAEAAEENRTFEKTTLYFHVVPGAMGKRGTNDFEGHTTLEWHTPEELLIMYKEQALRGTPTDLDESKIIEAYLRVGK